LSDLGPLPKADAASALRRDSVKALDACLPSNEFVFRRELEDDYGVDGSLEVLSEGRATNMRAQVQLKARTGTAENKDGSVSVSIETANLNYLQNGNCPLYVLYRPETKEIRFTFAHPEWLRITSENPRWRDTQFITIRFSEVLNSSTLRRVRDAIVSTAQLQRAVTERVAVLSLGLTGTVHIDPSSMQVTDTEEIAATLLRDGFALVTAGEAALVADKGRTLPSTTRDRFPRLNLILAFAEYYRSRYVDADSYLRELLIRAPSPLSTEDKGFASYLLHSIDYLTGRTTRETFVQTSDSWRATAPPILALQYDIIYRWELHRSAEGGGDDAQRSVALKELRAALVAARSATVPAVRAQAELRELLLDGGEFTGRYIDARCLAENPRLPWDTVFPNQTRAQVLGALEQSWEEWKTRVLDLATAATERGDGYLCCEARLLFYSAALRRVRMEVLLKEAKTGAGDVSIPSEIGAGLRDSAAMARKLGNLELELRAELGLSSLADTIGDRLKALAVARDVKRRAALARYATLERDADDILAGNDAFSDWRAQASAFQDEQAGDELLAKMTPQTMQAMARSSCEALGIPYARAENVLSSGLAEKVLAETRRDWCRHMGHVEQSGHEQSLETMYAQPTEKRIVCRKLGRASALPHADGPVLVNAFKRAHCADCPERSPWKVSS
jgi:hypothetical protein